MVRARSVGKLAAGISTAGLLLATAQPARAQCVDEELKQQLVGKRAYRGVVPRLFKKALRHELSPIGGWMAPQVADGQPVYGGAYTFHFTEELGLEAEYLRSRQSYGLLEAISDRNQRQVGLTSQDLAPAPMNLYLGHLVWSMAYGKVRWVGSSIGRLDFHLALGAGVVDAPDSQGIAGSGGFGLKFYVAEWLAVRLDVRDLVHQQRPPLGEEHIVNDILTTAGLSVFFPFKS